MQASNADVTLLKRKSRRDSVLKTLPKSQTGNHSSLSNQVAEADLRALGTALLLQACILSLQ